MMEVYALVNVTADKVQFFLLKHITRNTRIHTTITFFNRDFSTIRYQFHLIQSYRDHFHDILVELESTVKCL